MKSSARRAVPHDIMRAEYHEDFGIEIDGGNFRRLKERSVMKTILFYLLEPFADWECAYLSSAVRDLGAEKYEVKTVAPSKEPVHSMGGFTVLPDYDLASVPGDFEGLILVGGMSWRKEDARRVTPLVRRALDGGRVLGAICGAATFLGTIGALNGFRHTGNDLEDLKELSGAAYTGEADFISEQAVRDGKLITANGTAALEFARETLLALGVAPEAKILEWYDFYKRGFYPASARQPDAGREG